MNIKRLVLSSLVLFVTALIWNGLPYTLILKDINDLVLPLRRQNMDELMWLAIMMTFGITVLFAFGYCKFAKTGTLIEGIGYGVFFALLAGLFVDLNQYLLYPLPGKAALYWFPGGLGEFILYGVLMTKIYPGKKAGIQNS